MRTKTKITTSQVLKLLGKLWHSGVELSDLSEHELYILLRATYNELANMGSKLTLFGILRLNAKCITD